MKFRLADVRRGTAWARRDGVVAALAALVVGSLAVLAVAAWGARDRETARSNRVVAAAAEAARTMAERPLALLDRIAASAAGGEAALPDAGSAPAPGVRAVLVLDPAGATLQQTGAPDTSAVAALRDTAARLLASVPAGSPPAILRDSRLAPDLIGAARTWTGRDGGIGGIALVVFDRSVFTGLDQIAGLLPGGYLQVFAGDGDPIFGAPAPADRETAQAPVAGTPLAIAYAGAPIDAPASPFAVSGVGLAAALALAVVLLRRRRAALRETARRDAVEGGLRGELAELRRAVDRSDETSRSKSRFFAQVTHELRTPLNAILGFSEAIRQEMFGPVANPRYRDYAGLIHDAGSHLLSLINDLLDSARIEAGKMEIAPIRVSAAALARSALDLVELSAEARGITLAANDLGACPDLNVDPRAFKQVLVNLLSNAVKFTLPGGRVAVDFAAAPDGRVTITVNDTGIGMSPDDVAHAFEPFGRGERARLQEGTGLGLSLARALVRLHGGDLTLSSRIHAGTTVTITLPASAAFTAEPPPPATAAAQDGDPAAARAA